VSWAWTIGSRGSRGTATVTCTGLGQRKSARANCSIRYDPWRNQSATEDRFALSPRPALHGGAQEHGFVVVFEHDVALMEQKAGFWVVVLIGE
jgi:hypothetical protein